MGSNPTLSASFTMRYLDTNVYNALCDRIPVDRIRTLDGVAATDHMEVVLSPINVIEVMTTPDPLRRERIIFLIQHLCSPRLLAEPEALVVDFIVEKSCDQRLKALALHDPFCVSDLQRAWDDVRQDKQKTFILAAEGLEFMKMLKALASVLHACFSREGRLDTLGLDLRSLGRDEISRTIRNRAGEIRRRAIQGGASISDYTWVLGAMLVCVGVTPFPQAIDKMWFSLGIQDPQVKIEYTNHQFSFLQSEGPLVGMGAMAAWQSRRGYDWGNLMDCYHVSYLPYVGEFLTLDTSLVEFATEHRQVRALKAITRADEWVDQVCEVACRG